MLAGTPRGLTTLPSASSPAAACVLARQTRAPKSLHTHDDLRPPKMAHVKDLKLRAKLSKMALDEKRAEKSRVESELVRPAPPPVAPSRRVLAG